MKNMLMRPASALFPAVLLASMLLGERIIAANLYVIWLMMQLFSLCSIDAFRNAAAREPGVRRVDRRFSGTWPVILLGIAITIAVSRFLSGKTEFLNAELWTIIAGGCIIIEQLFEERMFALSRRIDGVVLSIISNALLFVGLLLDASGGVTAPVEMAGFYTVCGAGLGMVISIIANYVIEPMHAFSLVPRNIAFAPKAMVQCLLYPVVMMPLFGVAEAAAAGLILWRLSRTVCRRSKDESRKLNLLLITAAAAMVIANLWVPGLEKYGNAVIVAMLCAILVFCTLGWRVYTGVALVLAAYEMLWNPILPDMWGMIAKIAACALAIGLNLHKAFLRKV